MTAPLHLPTHHVVKLDDFVDCSACTWRLEPGMVAIVVGEERFCSERCLRKAMFAPAFDLGGEAG